MNEAHGVKKYGADKIAFLGLFILALLLAHFITFSRHTLPSKAGSKAIAEIKAAGISSLLSDRNRQDFFLIKDAKGHTIGFTMDTLAESETETQLNIQATGYSYIRGLYVQEQVTFFQSDNSFDEFVWKSEIVGRAGRKDTRIILSRDGTVTVTSFGREQKEQSYKPDSTPIPGVLFDLLLSQMLHSGYKKIIVGKGGQMIKTVGQEARKDIERLLGTRVFLELFVRVDKDWTQSERMLKELGYSKK